MSPAPAAAAAADEDVVGAPDLHRRLRRLLARSARGEADALAGLLLPASSSPRAPARLHRDGFYWLLIPEWVADGVGLTARPDGRRRLEELCWIQYLVYGLFRVQDDLLDGDCADLRLAVSTNHLVTEAAARAARLFARGTPFWEIFQQRIDATSRALLRLGRLQASPERPEHAELELYRELSACLGIATAGVALLGGREELWRRSLAPALDRLAVAAQIVDDLRDLDDDLRAGRINYAAWYLARPVFGSTPEATAAVAASNLATTERLDGLLATARGEVDGALATLDDPALERVAAYLADYRKGVGELGTTIRGRRDDLWRGSPARYHPAS